MVECLNKVESAVDSINFHTPNYIGRMKTDSLHCAV